MDSDGAGGAFGIESSGTALPGLLGVSWVVYSGLPAGCVRLGPVMARLRSAK
jgi:hypothetical protein